MPCETEKGKGVIDSLSFSIGRLRPGPDYLGLHVTIIKMGTG